MPWIERSIRVENTITASGFQIDRGASAVEYGETRNIAGGVPGGFQNRFQNGNARNVRVNIRSEHASVANNRSWFRIIDRGARFPTKELS
jgi:hypothetical protein